MSTSKTGIQYDEDFKRTLVNLYPSGGKTQDALCNEYGVSLAALFNVTSSVHLQLLFDALYSRCSFSVDF